MKKCPFFLQRPFYCLGYIGLKQFRVGRQQERTYISFKPNATLYINAPIFGEQCFDVDVWSFCGFDPSDLLCALSTDHADTFCRVQIFVLREFYTFLSHAVATMIHGCISLSSWCLLVVVCLFLAVPWGCLLFVIVVFPDRAHILFLGSEYPLNLLYMNHKTGDLETCFASLDSKWLWAGPPSPLSVPFI